MCESEARMATINYQLARTNHQVVASLQEKAEALNLTKTEAFDELIVKQRLTEGMRSLVYLVNVVDLFC